MSAAILSAARALEPKLKQKLASARSDDAEFAAAPRETSGTD